MIRHTSTFARRHFENFDYVSFIVLVESGQSLPFFENYLNLSTDCIKKLESYPQNCVFIREIDNLDVNGR